MAKYTRDEWDQKQAAKVIRETLIPELIGASLVTSGGFVMSTEAAKDLLNDLATTLENGTLPR